MDNVQSADIEQSMVYWNVGNSGHDTHRTRTSHAGVLNRGNQLSWSKQGETEARRVCGAMMTPDRLELLHVI